ncbi:hypothetical protein GY45DRAFT_1340927 [Cubamyces sp. BRFM 1775]|nr:hypothetical protein GY45DRAFT_1340927 [Cubamyces sp. BRFM 1775]
MHTTFPLNSPLRSYATVAASLLLSPCAVSPPLAKLTSDTHAKTVATTASNSTPAPTSERTTLTPLQVQEKGKGCGLPGTPSPAVAPETFTPPSPGWQGSIQQSKSLWCSGTTAPPSTVHL